MLPRADVPISWHIDYEHLRSPSAEVLEYGGFGTRAYSIAFVVDATWENAELRLLHERELIDRIASTARDETEFDALAGETEEEDDIILDPSEGFVVAPEIGVHACSLALCAAGCVTAASCRGHPGEHAWAKWPVILFSADRRRVRVLERIARASGCGLAIEGGIRLWAPSLAEVLKAAELTIAERARFDKLPLPEALRNARGLPASAPRQSAPTPPQGQQSLF